LGVEIIARPELSDLALGYETNRVIRAKRYGFMGLLAGLSVKNTAHVFKSSQPYITTKSAPNPEPTEQEDLKSQRKKAITQLYDEAHQHEEEIAMLEQQKSKHQQLILELQKEAAILTLDYS